MIEFKERLKSLRVTNNVLQKDIAQYLEISPRAYQHYETGTRYPDFKGLLQLADYFNVSLDYLVGRSDDPLIHKWKKDNHE